MQKQPKESEFDIKLIKLIKLNFEHKENIKNIDEFSLDVGLRPEYIKNEDLIQFYLYVKIDLYQNVKIDLYQNDNENKKIEICSIESQIAGMFGYNKEIDKKLLPNIASILYSYLRPIISQLSIMAKIPPIDLPILNLSDIEVKEINK